MCIMFSKTCVAGLFLIKFCKMRKTFCILKLKQLMLEAEVFDLKLHENWDNIYDKTIHYQFSYNIKKHTGKSLLSVLHICKFHAHRYNWSQIKNFKKFQKTKLKFVTLKCYSESMQSMYKYTLLYHVTIS